MNYQNTAEKIVNACGGSENIQSATHCVTRLRLVLKDDSKFDQEAVEKLSGVLGVVNSSGQRQIVLGPEVNKVYEEVTKLLPSTSGEDASSQEKKPFTIKGMFSSALDTLIACFVPSISAIAGSGMIKVLAVLLSTFGIISADSSTYIILNGIGDAIFVFLPFFVAVNAARKMKTDMYLALVLAAILFYPNIQALAAAETAPTFFGMTVQILDYSSQAIPMIFGVWLLKYADKLADKLSPNIVKVFLRPMIALLITAPILLFIIGPASMVLGDLFAKFCEIMNTWGWIAVGINAALFPIMVLTGTHNATIPLLVQMFATQGFDSVFLVGGLAANLSQAGAAAAVAVKSKNKELKSNAGSAAVSALLGITEPAMYGVNLPLKKPFVCMLLSALASGCLMGLAKLSIPTFVTPSVLTASIFFGENTNPILGIISIASAVAIAFVLTWFSGFKDWGKEMDREVLSPMDGTIIPLEEMKDETFSKKLMGEGYALQPEGDTITAPCSGVVTTLFPTKHAIGITAEDGTELLIHIGIDTVNNNGKDFTAFVKQNDKITAEQPLVKFNKEKLEKEGYDLTTAIIFTNGKKPVIEYGKAKSGKKVGQYE